jgi:hypothetical protein
VQFSSLGDVTSIPCEIESRVVIKQRREETRHWLASGAVTRNASASCAGVETVQPMGMGMGGQSGAVKKQLGPIDDVQTSFLSCPPVHLFNYLFLFSSKFS